MGILASTPDTRQGAHRELSSPEVAEAVLAYLREWPTASIRRLARSLGIGRSTANRAVHRLLETGVLTIERPGTGDGYPTRYRVLDGDRG